MIRALSSLLLLLPIAARAGFNFGSGCEGGSGKFEEKLENAGQIVTLGTIPKGKWSVMVKLEADSDVDIQIYDADDTEAFPEGKAIVAYCAEKGCNKGALGNNDGSQESTEHEGMKITYSGYEGVSGKPGNEFIKVEGEATRNIIMKVFAFQPGTAKVSYEWGRTRTGCCLGISPCGGSFDGSVEEGKSMVLGEIPSGKKDVIVKLTAENDLDIQLWDITKAAVEKCGDGGAPIIAYSEDEDACKKGVLGSAEGEESGQYEGVTYHYSGYGTGETAGNEFLRVDGVGNKKLNMKAFGYKSGNFQGTFEYWEDYVDEATKNVPYVGFNKKAIAVQNVAARYTDVPVDTIIVRRGNKLTFGVQHRAGMTGDRVTVSISDDEGDKSDLFVESIDKVSASPVSVQVEIKFRNSAPAGRYKLAVSIRMGDQVQTVSKSLIVLFNPYSSKTPEYMSSKSQRGEYVENEDGLVWQGKSDNFDGYYFRYAQHEYATLDLAIRSLRRMPTKDRGNLVLVSRHLTYSVGEDICYGKWGEGSYTSGRPSGGYTCSKSKDNPTCFSPEHWSDLTELFALHVAKGFKKVQYCQCFVFAAVMASLGRSLGVATRPVTTFQSAHDTDKNRAIEKFYKIEGDIWDPVEDHGVNTHDSVWSFHVWDEMYFDRDDIDCKAMEIRSASCANGWQAVDATPQELSAGGSGVPEEPVYQMGPASIKLVKANRDPVCKGGFTDTKFGCFDNEFVISEVNADLNLWRQDPSSEKGWTLHGNFHTDPWDKFATVGLSISTKRVGPISELCKREDEEKSCDKERHDLTSSYKSGEPSGPGKITIAGNGPFKAGGHERRLEGETVGFQLGVYPKGPGPIVNLPGHSDSIMRTVLKITNSGDEDVTVACSFHATAHSYDGGYYFPSNRAKSLVGQASQRIVVKAGSDSQECEYMFGRYDYVRFASTFLDEGMPDMSSGEKAYMIKVEVTANVVGSDMPFISERSKIICTPRNGLTTRSGAVCEGNRGVWKKPTDEELGLAHLEGDVDTLKCNKGVINNGVCNPKYNIKACNWDGGDCCRYSCWSKNGQFITDNGDGGWEFNHKCASIDEEKQCKDSKVKNFSPSPDFSDRPEKENLDGGKKADSRAKCVEMYKEALKAKNHCGNAKFARIAVDCEDYLNALIQEHGHLRRCAPRTKNRCRCKMTWKEKTRTYKNQKCATRRTRIHKSDYCRVVPGSCDTPTGQPPKGRWWDDCTTGEISSLTPEDLQEAGIGSDLEAAELQKPPCSAYHGKKMMCKKRKARCRWRPVKRECISRPK